MISSIAACSGSDRPGASEGQDDRILRRVIQHKGVEREYFVHLPEGLGDSLPVVVGIHGYTSTASGFQASHGLNRHADAHGYITVVPQGTHFWYDDEENSPSLVTSWNDLASNMPPKTEGPHCVEYADRYPCPPDCEFCLRCAWTSCADDVGFIDKMLDAVHAEFSTDPSRTYLLGVSNGGMMTLRLGCDLSSRFAAIAPIIGQLAPGYACGPDGDLPMIHLFGGEDNTVRYDGQPAADGFIYTTAARTAEVWASALDCESGPQEWPSPIADEAGLQCAAYSNCRNDSHAVVSCLDPDGGHQWPEQFVRDVPATCVASEQYESIPGQHRCVEKGGDYVHLGMDLIWDFFSRYERPAR